MVGQQAKLHQYSQFSIVLPQIGPSTCGKTSAGLPLILHCDDLYNYFIIYQFNNRNKVHNVMLESSWNHPPNPCPWKDCLPRSWSLVPKRSRTTYLEASSLTCLVSGLWCLIDWEWWAPTHGPSMWLGLPHSLVSQSTLTSYMAAQGSKSECSTKQGKSDITFFNLASEII